VHPQTVRYRLRHLQEMFGEAMNEPTARFDLEIALRARALLGEATSAGAERPAGWTAPAAGQ